MNYEIIDHGIEHEQYFSGCGISFTPWENVVTGIGDDYARALDDCLEQIASMGENVPVLTELEEELKLALAEVNTLSVGPDDYECHYYVSIRWGAKK